MAKNEQEKQPITQGEKTAITQLSNQIINSENRIEELKGERAALGDISKTSEKYQELTDAIKTHRKRVHVLYEKIEKISPAHADRLEKYIDNHFTQDNSVKKSNEKIVTEPIYETIPGDKKGIAEVEVPITVKRARSREEIQSAVKSANDKFNEFHKDIDSKSFDKREKTIEIKKKPIKDNMSQNLSLDKANKKLDQTEKKLATIKKRNKTLTGKIMNLFGRKNKEELMNQKKLLIDQIKTLKGEPIKGILKPPLTEKLANAQEKVKANAQEKASPTLNSRPKTSHTI
ncbi:hypothetical protein C6P52_10120 [Enterococcus mundtii]|uniref:hypothetical protein n=1 Tax=Enterococcus mundtii TaxID=53346 RepID=UPI000D37DBDD|nr:hypothetical protein [Enterococcus mundtii]PTO38167.1 hypothetical protein C6P52_10120 [Enterococcus mundtii]PTO44252.1 hypothetical protein C6P54_06030 [Enterococcus mundtii]